VPACGSSLRRRGRREAQSSVWTLVGTRCWGVSPRGAVPSPSGCTRSPRPCLCCRGLGDRSRSGWSHRASLRLTQPMGEVSGSARQRAQVRGGIVQYPACVPASQLLWFELVRRKLAQTWEQRCCAPQAAVRREVGCPATVQELLLPGGSIIYCGCYSFCTRKLLILHVTAFSILCRWLAGLIILASKITRVVYPMGGLAPSAKINPPRGTLC